MLFNKQNSSIVPGNCFFTRTFEAGVRHHSPSCRATYAPADYPSSVSPLLWIIRDHRVLQSNINVQDGICNRKQACQGKLQTPGNIKLS